MESLVIVLPIATVMFGLYFIMLGFWELREGINKKKYINYMFTGLFLLFTIAPLLVVFLNYLNLKIN